MNWDSLYTMQHQLDQYIVKQHELNETSLLEDKTLALLVELGELANETRCFKFWSTKKPSSKEVILEEYVDGLHFILSLGVDTGFRYVSSQIHPYDRETEAFLHVYEYIDQFKKRGDEITYQQLFSGYLNLGVTLGFSEQDIQSAYHTKNEVNYKRQDEGY